MITKNYIDDLRIDLSLKAKNGINFTLSAGFTWLLISWIWALNFNSYNKSILTFIAGALMLPLALLFAKVLKIKMINKENQLHPLGLWLNISQLFYFPFLIFSLIKFPDNFVMIYVIITGAHFFPYSWFYKTNLYAIFAGIIAVGAMLLGLVSEPEDLYIIPVFISVLLFLLTVLLYFDFKKKLND